jgi:hypothetical protein
MGFPGNQDDIRGSPFLSYLRVQNSYKCPDLLNRQFPPLVKGGRGDFSVIC